MSTTPSSHPAGPPETSHYGTARWVPILFAILILWSGYLLYAVMQARQGLARQAAQADQKIAQLHDQLEKANAQIDDLKAELNLTSQKLGLTQEQLDRARQQAAALRREQAQTARKLQEQLGQVQKQTQESFGQLSNELGSTKSDVAATKEALADTRSRLERTVGDLGVVSGLVAHNKEELEELKRLGERNYYEFDLRKSKQPTRLGPILVQLAKADTKHWRYNMYVTVEDKRIEKKDKTLYEPVQFYVRGARAPYEIVVFDIKKDEVIGYLSTPKEQRGAQNSADTPHSN